MKFPKYVGYKKKQKLNARQFLKSIKYTNKNLNI